jgi:hypothetical protein
MTRLIIEANSFQRRVADSFGTRQVRGGLRRQAGALRPGTPVSLLLIENMSVFFAEFGTVVKRCCARKRVAAPTIHRSGGGTEVNGCPAQSSRNTHRRNRRES